MAPETIPLKSLSSPDLSTGKSKNAQKNNLDKTFQNKQGSPLMGHKYQVDSMLSYFGVHKRTTGQTHRLSIKTNFHPQIERPRQVGKPRRESQLKMLQPRKIK